MTAKEWMYAVLSALLVTGGVGVWAAGHTGWAVVGVAAGLAIVLLAPPAGGSEPLPRPLPSAREVKEYREAHPGVSIEQAIREIAGER